MTINNANINYQTSLAQVSQSVPKEPKENANNSQELQQSDTPNNAKEDSDIFAIARMKAFESVKRNFGYGINDEGFFTSDLNEAAGIPKDYRIHSELLEIIDPLFTQKGLYGGKATHLSVDWAKTLGDFYHNSFKGSITNEVFGEALSEKQYREIFKDTISSWEQILKSSDNMASNKGFALTKKFFENNWFHNIKGETNTNGKINGFDNNDSEYQSFRNFMDANQFDDPTLPPDLNQHNLANGWSASSSKMTLVFQAQHLSQMPNKDDELKELSAMISDIQGDYFKLLENDELSLEDFKAEYLKIKERHDEWAKKYREKMQTLDETNTESQKQFQPIQVTSKNETYKDTDFLNTLDFIKSQQKLEQILLLFGEGNKGSSDIKDLKKYFTSPNRLDTEA